MDYDVRFCTSADGTRIAYAIRDDGKPALLFLPGWAFAIEAMPLISNRATPPKYGLVCFDRRGVGRSQRDVDDISLDRQVEDVVAVVEACGLAPVHITSEWDGTPITMAFAAQHPESVLRMVLSGPYARGADIISRAALQGTVDMARTNWALARRYLASIGGAQGEDLEAYIEILRRAATPEMAARYIELYGSLDATEYLDRVHSPTLVIYRPHNGAVPRAATEFVASRLSDCQFLRAHSYGETTKAGHSFLWPDVAQTEAPRSSAPEPSAFRTVLFTDLVGHTEMMQRLGDEKGREVLREHERITRECLAAHGGAEVKTMGDGFLASFGSVTKAVECAVALQKALSALTPDPSPAAAGEGQSVFPLQIRCGLNAGEPIEEDGDLFGTTVILASRIAARAEGGEILVANTVRELCAGKAFSFTDRGEFVAKGFEEPMRVYEVRWRD